MDAWVANVLEHLSIFISPRRVSFNLAAVILCSIWLNAGTKSYILFDGKRYISPTRLFLLLCVSEACGSMALVTSLKNDSQRGIFTVMHLLTIYKTVSAI